MGLVSRAAVLFSALLLTALPELGAEKIDNRREYVDVDLSHTIV